MEYDEEDNQKGEMQWLNFGVMVDTNKNALADDCKEIEFKIVQTEKKVIYAGRDSGRERM